MACASWVAPNSRRSAWSSLDRLCLLRQADAPAPGNGFGSLFVPGVTPLARYKI